MRIGNLNQSTYTFVFSAPCIDSEEKEIIKRLLSYGATPTGDKMSDKALLRRIEEQKAKQESVPTGKYLTVSSQEIEKIIERRKGAKMLGDYNKHFLINFTSKERQD